MKVNELEGREVFIIGFGGVFLLTTVVLTSIYVGHKITTISAVPQPVQVQTAPPAVSVNVPQQAAPRIEVTAAAPKVDVHVPAGPAPTVNVSTPPATVTVVERERPTIPEPKPATIAPKTDPKPLPAVVDPHSEAAPTVDELYMAAEKYIETQCKKSGLDPVAENTKWLKLWQSRVADSGFDEQRYLNDTVVNSRDCFDVNKATPEKIVEACRLILRYRDAKLQWLQALKDALAAPSAIQKTVAFLTSGVK